MSTSVSSRVSIIMPVYNGERFIAQAINSVLAQTWQDWELIVIDDGSTDGTSAIIQAYTDLRIRYYYQENHGQTTALNHGLELAHGDCITTLDADDWLTPDSLQERVTYLNSHPEIGVVYCDGYYCDLSGEIIKRFSANRSGNPVDDVYSTIIATPFFAAGSPVMIRSTILNQLQIKYDESIVWCQDWDFYIRVAEHALWGYIDSPTVYYRVHSTNMTFTMPEGRRLQSLIRTSQKVMDSTRFAVLAPSQKQAFFNRFLIYDLKGRMDDQEQVVNSIAFRKLPPQQKSGLLRRLATSYLLQDEQRVRVRKWLRSAWLLTPYSIRTSAILALTVLNFNLAVSVTKSWHQKHSAESYSPFAQPKKPE